MLNATEAIAAERTRSAESLRTIRRYLPSMPVDKAAALAEHAEQRVFKRGDYLYCAGEPITGLWIVTQGILSGLKFQRDGEGRLVTPIFPGHCLPTALRVAEVNYFNLFALSEGSALFIPKAPAMRILDDVASADALHLNTVKTLFGFTDMVANMNETSSLTRLKLFIAHYISYEEFRLEGGPQRYRWNMTLADLAQFIRVTRPHIQVNLKKPEIARLFSINRRVLTVHCADGLRPD
ncbi:MAG: Crp/Fnr family transcriptional regulator [Flavobacteriaceae bacterium]